VTGSVSNPVFLRLRSGAVDSELLSLLIISCCGLHLRSIVSVTQLCEAETTHVLQRVYLAHEWQVTLSMQSHQGAAKQVELDGKLG
jgi:hypothetical protein